MIPPPLKRKCVWKPKTLYKVDSEQDGLIIKELSHYSRSMKLFMTTVRLHKDPFWSYRWNTYWLYSEWNLVYSIDVFTYTCHKSMLVYVIPGGKQGLNLLKIIVRACEDSVTIHCAAIWVNGNSNRSYLLYISMFCQQTACRWCCRWLHWFSPDDSNI